MSKTTPCPRCGFSDCNYQWAEDKNGEPLNPEKPVDEYDHALDGLRYALFSLLRPRMDEQGVETRDLVAEHGESLAVVDLRLEM